VFCLQKFLNTGAKEEEIQEVTVNCEAGSVSCISVAHIPYRLTRNWANNGGGSKL
jgi:hypothetical protein